jgi:uncharacterized protein (DUF2147 family)
MRLAMIAAVAALAIPGIAAARVPAGIWQNPKGTVRVQFRQCGAAMCGRVIWASADAEADARAAGAGPLVGTDLFSGFTPAGTNQWSGSVVIPDLHQAVSGTITQTNPTTLVGEGCLFAGIGCKQQIWHKIR